MMVTNIDQDAVGKISEEIFEREVKYAEACTAYIMAAEYVDRVLLDIRRVLVAQPGEKAPSEAKLDRESKDHAAYREAVDKRIEAEAAKSLRFAELNFSRRRYEIAMH